MERKAVNCAEVHSADWISILYERWTIVCVSIRHRERGYASPLDVGWRNVANRYRSRRRTIPMENSKWVFPRWKRIQDIAKRKSLKLIKKFEVDVVDPPGSGHPVYARNLELVKRTPFFRVRKKLFFGLHTQEVGKRVLAEACKMLPTLSGANWLVSRV